MLHRYGKGKCQYLLQASAYIYYSHNYQKWLEDMKLASPRLTSEPWLTLVVLVDTEWPSDEITLVVLVDTEWPSDAIIKIWPPSINHLF